MSGERHMTMQEALEADGEKLRQLTGEDHGPWDSSGKGNEMTDVPDDVRRRLQAHDLSAAETRSLLALAYRQIDGDSPFTSHDAKTILALLERVDARAALAPKAKQCMETLLGLGGSDDDETIRQQIALCDMASAYLDLCEAVPVAALIRHFDSEPRLTFEEGAFRLSPGTYALIPRPESKP